MFCWLDFYFCYDFSIFNNFIFCSFYIREVFYFLVIFSNFFYLNVLKDMNASFVLSHLQYPYFLCVLYLKLMLVTYSWGVESCEGFLKISLFYSYKRKYFFFEIFMYSNLFLYSNNYSIFFVNVNIMLNYYALVSKLNCSFCLILFFSILLLTQLKYILPKYRL